MKPNDIFGVAMSRVELFGPALAAFMEDATRHIGSCVAMIEETARRENRVELSPDEDACGMPLARVVHSFDDEALALWSYVKDQGQAVMKAAGAREHWAGPMGSGHLIGGTVMGEAPETSVTDGYGRVHDVGNLLLGGSGLFPASGGVSPTFTLTALAERSAREVADRWSAYAA
jgi:choline dehydrogenase-like flavoprotein